ncbi:MAG: hypothetical protein ACE14S_03825 [Candidatus Bathyarchaeia archaeon]
MSSKVKKQASEMSFSLSRWFSKISTMKPSATVVSLVVMGVAIFLFGGGLYDIIVQPLPAVYYGQRFYFLYPELGSQFIFDTVIAVILYLIGFVGLLSIYQSSRHAYNPRQAYMTLVVGSTLLLIAYFFLEYYIRLKLG